MTNTSKNIISRLINDGEPLRSISEYQETYIEKFKNDERIKYVKLEKCVICNSKETIQVAEKDQWGIPLTTVLCKGCGVLYSLNQLDDLSTNIFYDEYYRKIYEGVVRPTLDHPFYMKLYSGWVPEIPRFVNSESTILEFGCSGGWNLLPYKKRNIKHIGFDYDKAMIKFGKENYDINLIEGGVEEAIALGIKADLIIISQVLEHTTNPILVLKDLSVLLKPDGVINIFVPCLNYMNFFGGNSTSFDMGLNLQNAHNFTFTEKTLKLTVIKAGYIPLLMIGGLCTIRYLGEKEEHKNKDSLSDMSHKETLQIINSSEKNIFWKRKLFTNSPKCIKVILNYSFYLSRPISFIRYLLIFKTSVGKTLLS